MKLLLKHYLKEWTGNIMSVIVVIALISYMDSML